MSEFFKNIKKKTNTINEIKVLINNGKINKEIIFNENSKPLFNIIKYDKLVSYVKSKVSKNNYISFKKLKNDNHLLNIVNKNFGLVFSTVFFCMRSTPTSVSLKEALSTNPVSGCGSTLGLSINSSENKHSANNPYN